MEDLDSNAVNSPLETEEPDNIVQIHHHESGHRGWKCNYCNDENLRATDLNMNTHLALICQNVPLDIRQDCLRNFPVPNKRRTIVHDIASSSQPRIDSKFQSISKMDPGQEQLCHKALTRLFICCGIPFWIVETRITISIEKELQNENNLTLDYSHKSHTAIFTADEIEKVLVDVGVTKFGAVVSDGASAMSLAKQYISDKYPRILPIRCIAHNIQLICSDIICKTLFGKKVLRQCQSFVTYFHASYRAGAILRNEIINSMINKGGLKSSVCLRWSSAYDCVQSVLNLEICFKQILDENESSMIPELQKLTRDRQFWVNVEVLAKVLSPAKNAIKIVESKATTTADIFLFLVQMASAINTLSANDLSERTEFRKQCIQFYNKRWKEFDIKFYILAYFLHPKYRGKGMKDPVFHQILYTALEIWKKIGGGLASANTLVAQIKKYDAFEPPYNYIFVEGVESPQT
ncbi:17448_t:CDS:2, partial [Cetraspora pellucida]